MNITQVAKLRDLSELGDFAAEAIKNDSVSFIAWYADRRILTVNRQFSKLTGYTSEEISSMGWPGDFVSGELAGRITEAMDLLSRSDKSCMFTGDIVRKDRSLAPIIILVHKYCKDSELLYFAFIEDITQYRRLEERLKLTQFAIDHFTDSSIWLDAGGRLMDVNDTACKTLGYRREELLAKEIWDISPGYDPNKYREVWEYVKKGGSVHLETTILTGEGKKIPVEIHASYIKFGGVERMIAFLHDITDRKIAQEALVESEEKFRVLADTAVAAIFLVGENRFIYANPAAQTITGYSAEELYRMHYWDIISPEFREEMIAYGDSLLRGEPVPGRFEIKFIRKDGSEGWCDVSIGPVKYLKRRGMAGVITALDVTERKHAEMALKESEEKFRVLAEMSPSAIFLYQGDKLIYANPAAVRLTGFTEEEIRAKNFWEMVHPEYREMVKMYGLARQKGEPVPVRYDVKYITRGGEERWAEFTAGRIEYLGKPAGIVTAYDMTERKNTEIALMDAKAQAELYIDLMGHDINNMNQAALGFLEIVGEKLATRKALGAKDLELINNAMDSLRRSSGLIASVRKLQKESKGGLKPEVMDLGKVLADVKGQYSIVPEREVIISYVPSCKCYVLANELLKDVFSNIVGNAIKHSQGAIAINISLQTAEEHDRLFCKVIIEDTGPGIPDEQKRSIFERAGSDKAKLTGKGLGLYLVRTLVDDYRGKVWVEDRVPGDFTKGSRFVIMFPAVR